MTIDKFTLKAQEDLERVQQNILSDDFEKGYKISIEMKENSLDFVKKTN